MFETENSATLDDGVLDALPIFPLPGIVLFPGAILPLHVFEPRYRALTQDVLAGDGFLAMTRLRHDDDDGLERAKPDVFPIAGVGQVEASRETSDGRFFLLVRGVARIAIREELPMSNGYRRVKAALLPDIPSRDPQVVAATERQLVRLCDELADAVEEAAELRELVRESDEAGRRADLVSAAVIADPDERQRLLETLDPADRIDRLIELIVEAMAELGIERSLN